MTSLRWGRVALLAVGVLAGIVLGLSRRASPVAEAAGTRWSQPVQLSDASSSTWAWWPTVSADDQGNVYVVWNAELPQTSQFKVDGLWLTRWNGQAWTKPSNIALIKNGYALRSALVADPMGKLYLLYKGFGSLDPAQISRGLSAVEDIWSTSATGAQADNVQTWQPPVRVTNNNDGYFSDLAMDSKGVLHAIWTEGDQTGTWGIYYAHSTDGGRTWSPRVALDGGNPVWWYRAHLVIDQQDHLHVVWEVLDQPTGSADGNGNGAGPTAPLGDTKMAYYAVSTDGGATWSKMVFPGHVVTPPFGKPFTVGPLQPSVGVDGSGAVLFVYREYDTNRIMYQRSTDGTHWTYPVPIPGVKAGIDRPYDMYSMATDSAGHVHLVMVGYPDNSSDLSVLHSEWEGSGWSAPEVIAKGPPYPEYPRIAIGQGNHVYVTWFDGDKADGNRDPIGVWFSSAIASAPQVARNWKPVGGGTTAAAAVATPAPAPVPTINVYGVRSPATAPATGPRPWYSAILDLRQDPAFGAALGPVMVIPLVLLAILAKSRVSAAQDRPFRSRR